MSSGRDGRCCGAAQGNFQIPEKGSHTPTCGHAQRCDVDARQERDVVAQDEQSMGLSVWPATRFWPKSDAVGAVAYALGSMESPEPPNEREGVRCDPATKTLFILPSRVRRAAQGLGASVSWDEVMRGEFHHFRDYE